MPNLNDKIEELRRLSKRAPYSYGNDVLFGRALRNDVPDLLAALDFRSEDAEIINDLLEDWVYSENHPAAAVLERWLGMARKMAQEEKR